MINKVFLSGYWKKNLGDDLFVKTICQRYPNTNFFLETNSENKNVFSMIKNLTIIDLNDDFTSRLKRKLLNPFRSFTNYYQVAQNVPIYVEIGGSIFILSDISNAKKDLKKRKRIREIAQKYFVIGSNFGPFINEKQLNDYSNFFKQTDGVVFRDIVSYNLFKDLGNIKIAPDAVLSLKHEVKKTDSNYVVVSIINLKNRDNITEDMVKVYEQNIIESCLYFLKNNKKVVLFGFCEYENDIEVMERILEKIPKELKVNILHYIHDDLRKSIDYLMEAELILATRFHAMILGWLYRKPTIVFSYSRKITDTIEYCYPEQYNVSIAKCEKLDTSILNDYSKLIIPETIRTDLINKAENHFYYLDDIL